MGRVERVAAWLGTAIGVAALMFAGFAPVMVLGRPFIAHSPAECISGLQANLHTPGHVSLVGHGYGIDLVVVVVLFLLPALAVERHARSRRRRWLVIVWGLAVFGMLAALRFGGCNAVLNAPVALLWGISALAGTIASLQAGQRSPTPSD